MIYSEDDLTALGCRIASISYESLAADSMTLEFVTDLRAPVPLPFAEGDSLHLTRDGVCIFRGWVTEVETSEMDFSREASITVQNVVAMLDVLPVTVSSYDTEQRLESAADLIRQALASARQCQMISSESFDVAVASNVLAVFSSGTESVWSAIMNALRWVANAASYYDHTTGTLHLLGGTVAEGSKATATVVMPAEVTAGTLTVGSTAIDVATLATASTWAATPAATLAKALRGSTEVAAAATDATTLCLTSRTPGTDGNALALSWAASDGAAADSAAPTITPFSGGDIAASGTQLATMESLLESDLPGTVVSTSTTRTAWESPPVCALRGRYTYTLPVGASIYQPGAFVYHVPKENVSLGGMDAENLEKYPATIQQTALPWQIVKGYKVPAGWRTLKGGAINMRSAVSNTNDCHTFWGRYFRTLRKVNQECLAYGAAVFEALPVAEAYPEEDEDDETGTVPGTNTWHPPTLESKNGPANYKEFTDDDTPNLYVLHEGSFPASSNSRGNVKGLHFCRGTLRQYVWLTKAATGLATPTEISDFFAGSMTTTPADGSTGETVAYTCLTLDAVFIDRRRKRYQEGTNNDTDPTEEDEQPDAGTQPSTELTEQDYIAALSDYYYSSRPHGTNGTVQIAKVRAYTHGTALGVLKSARWVPSSGELTLTTGAGGPLGMQAILQRQQVGRRQALNDLADKIATASQPSDDSTTSSEDAEEESYGMVGASTSANHQVDATAAKLEPFAVFLDDDGKRWINGGPLPTPGGVIDVPAQEITTWRQGRQYFIKATWNRTTRAWEGRLLYRDPEQQV